MLVELLVNCPCAKNMDDIRKTLNYYLSDSLYATPVSGIQYKYQHGFCNIIRFTVELNHKVKSVLDLLQSHMGVTLVYDTKSGIIWSIHRIDRLPKKIEMILAN